MNEDTAWLQVPSGDKLCKVSGLTGNQIRKLRPHNNHILRSGVSPMVTIREVKIRGQRNPSMLANKAELLHFVEMGGHRDPPPNRFNRFFKVYPFRHRTTVTDTEYILLTMPFCIGEEETLGRELVHLGQKPRIELAYTRKSVQVIQRRRS